MLSSASNDRLKIHLASAVVIATLAGLARADTVHLKDGSTLEGTIEDAETLLPGSATIRLVTRFGESEVPRTEISSIEWDSRDVEVLDPASFEDAAALKGAADLEYELGLQASQNARKDELVGNLHSQIAVGHLENARSGYSELAEQDPSRASFAERRVSEINSHIFWCNRFGGKVDDLGLDAGGKTLGEAAAAEEERERAADEALDAVRSFQRENPEALDETMHRYLDVVEEHPGTTAASNARGLISDVQDALLARAKRQRKEESTQAKAAKEAAAKETPPPPATPEELREKIRSDLTRLFESENFSVLAHGDYEEALPENVANQLEACLTVITSLTGVKPAKKSTEEDGGKLEVLLLANQEDFSRYTSGMALENKALQRIVELTASAKRSVLVMPEGNHLVCYRTSSLDEQVRRASVEHFLRDRLGQVPAFLGVGLGHYLELAELDKKGKKIRGSHPDSDMMRILERATSARGTNWRKRLTGSNSLLPIEELLTNPPEQADVFATEDIGRRIRQEVRRSDSRTQTWEAEAWAFIHWSLHGRGPKTAVKKLCGILEDGKSIFDAYRVSFGRTNSTGKTDDAFEKFIKDFAK